MDQRTGKRIALVRVDAPEQDKRKYDEEIIRVRKILLAASPPPTIEIIDDLRQLRMRLEKGGVDIITYFTRAVLEDAQEIEKQYKVKSFLFTGNCRLDPGTITIILKGCSEDMILQTILP